jgi:hypothetical protein
VLQWAAADTAAEWKACTKKLSAVGWTKGPARKSGAFFFSERGPLSGRGTASARLVQDDLWSTRRKE